VAFLCPDWRPAVANEGASEPCHAGVGMLEPDFRRIGWKRTACVKKEIRKAREATKGILGVNIMVALSNYADLAKTAIEEEIDIIFSGAGLPLNLPQFLKGSTKTKLAPLFLREGRRAS